jgi:p-cumate 2,3-dioxygenase ferredoxin subunit
MGETIVLCSANEVLEGEIKQAPLPDGSNVALYRVDGAIYATADMCTHGEASLAEEGIITGKTVECTFHFGTFDVTTGEPTGMPCEIALKTYPSPSLTGTFRSRSRKWQTVLTASPLPLKLGADRSARAAANPGRTDRGNARVSSGRCVGTHPPARLRPLRTAECRRSRLSPAPQLHHFPDQGSLVVATLEYVFERPRC